MAERDLHDDPEVRKILERLQRRPEDDKPLPRLKVSAPLPIGSARLYRMKVTLQGVEPPIWRRFVAPTFMKLELLHIMLQAVMGWERAHAFEFIIDGKRFVSKGGGFFVDSMWRTESGYDAGEYDLSQLIQLGTSITYIYDYGDNWEHEVVVEDDNHDQNTEDPAYCIEGERACPPEDCGGVDGYENLLEALANPKHPEHKVLREWIGGRFDSEHYDPKESNRRMGVKRPGDTNTNKFDHGASRLKKKQERIRKKVARKRNK